MTFASRFWEKVNKTPNGCWIWTGATDGRGYGQLWVNGHLEKAHRLSWVIHYGAIPLGLNILHHCDNKPCVRPDHLYLGTQADNARDALERGQFPVGIRNRNGAKTACHRGHLFDAENTYTDNDGRRHCRACNASRWRKNNGRAQDERTAVRC